MYSRLLVLVVVLGLFAQSLAHLGEPEDALPQLDYKYEPKGDFESIDDLPIYVARSSNPSPGRFVIWGYDIFGWVFPSRGFEMVDDLSELTGMTVIMPDFLRGGMIPEPEDYEWAKIMKVRSQMIVL